MSLVLRKPVFGVFDQARHKQGCAVTQKIARGLEFRISEVEGLKYPCSENKGADQLCGYRTTDQRRNRTTDQRRCFRKCKNPVFSERHSNRNLYKITKMNKQVKLCLLCSMKTCHDYFALYDSLSILKYSKKNNISCYAKALYWMHTK